MDTLACWATLGHFQLFQWNCTSMLSFQNQYVVIYNFSILEVMNIPPYATIYISYICIFILETFEGHWTTMCVVARPYKGRPNSSAAGKSSGGRKVRPFKRRRMGDGGRSLDTTHMGESQKPSWFFADILCGSKTLLRNLFLVLCYLILLCSFSFQKVSWVFASVFGCTRFLMHTHISVPQFLGTCFRNSTIYLGHISAMGWAKCCRASQRKRRLICLHDWWSSDEQSQSEERRAAFFILFLSHFLISLGVSDFFKQGTPSEVHHRASLFRQDHYSAVSRCKVFVEIAKARSADVKW